MIKILQIDGRSAPTMFCDVCEHVIEKASDGEYLIPKLKDGEAGKIVFGHFACTKSYEKLHYSQTGEIVGNMGLDHLLFCLVENLGADLDQARANSDALRGLP